MTSSHASTAIPGAGTAASGPLLALRGVHKTWGGRPVLEGADLELSGGGLYWLGGRNGVGKTTLLRIAAGLIRADAGAVELDGLDPEGDRAAFQARLGFLPAGNGTLYARLTVLQNLDFWAALALIPRRERGQAVERAVERFGLRELAGRRVDRMSMGQRQRVRLAIAFVHDPDVVLLDEPHTSLDDEGVALVSEALIGVRKRGGVGVWCSPKVEEARVPLDAAWVIDSGRTVAA